MFENVTPEIPERNEAPSGGPATYDDEARSMIDQLVEDKVLATMSDPAFDAANMTIRFSDLVNSRMIQDKSVAVIGAGNLGHPTFRTVCNLGFKSVFVIDDDVIDVENISPQDHDLVEIGVPKVKFLERWALRHCGVRVTAIQERLNGLGHLEELVNHMPDIIITCVDNMDIRNQLYAELMENYRHGRSLPELLIDMRMGAGQWQTFIIPFEVCQRLNTIPFGVLEETITKEMVFADNEGVQEACTARATCFTGMNAASYIGAFLTWYSNNAPLNSTAVASFFSHTDETTPFKYEKSFNSMKWRQVTKPPEEALQHQRFIEANNKLMYLESAQEENINRMVPIFKALMDATDSELSPEILDTGDILLVKGLGPMRYVETIGGNRLACAYLDDASGKIEVVQRSNILFAMDAEGVGRHNSKEPAAVYTRNEHNVGDFARIKDTSLYSFAGKILEIRAVATTGSSRSRQLCYRVVNPRDAATEAGIVPVPLDEIAEIISRDRVNPEALSTDLVSVIPDDAILENPVPKPDHLYAAARYGSEYLAKLIEAHRQALAGEPAEPVPNTGSDEADLYEGSSEYTVTGMGNAGNMYEDEVESVYDEVEEAEGEDEPEERPRGYIPPLEHRNPGVTIRPLDGDSLEATVTLPNNLLWSEVASQRMRQCLEEAAERAAESLGTRHIFGSPANYNESSESSPVTLEDVHAAARSIRIAERNQYQPGGYVEIFNGSRYMIKHVEDNRVIIETENGDVTIPTAYVQQYFTAEQIFEEAV